MTRLLNLLLIEDSARDAALLALYLRRAGFEASITRVDNRLDLKLKLTSGGWDVVVSDFHLPGFDAFAAMSVVRESAPQLPFIVLSGELAPRIIETITANGSEFVPKYEMRNIVPIIERAIEGRS